MRLPFVCSNTALFVDFRFARRGMPATSVPTKIIEKTVIITHLKIAGGRLDYSEVLRQELQEAPEQVLPARLAACSKIPSHHLIIYLSEEKLYVAKTPCHRRYRIIRRRYVDGQE
jgi:hypothetical protein